MNFEEAKEIYFEKLSTEQALYLAMKWCDNGIWDYLKEAIRNIEGEEMENQFIELVKEAQKKKDIDFQKELI